MVSASLQKSAHPAAFFIARGGADGKVRDAQGG